MNSGTVADPYTKAKNVPDSDREDTLCRKMWFLETSQRVQRNDLVKTLDFKEDSYTF